ncbi:MAG: hypothetical protein JRJ87_09515, partial [Deltaproteobacteria bacterium]|nr:hypothetical protein [Deltaproteobacteria bacterium]
ADRTVNRIGTGELDNVEKALFIGATADNLFERFMQKVSDDMFAHAGSYAQPEPRGKPCKLKIAFRRPKNPIGFEFSFGSESEGPPEELAELVKYATELTEAWYETQKQMAARADEAKDCD